jgi:uncharacterized transporter YbjL
MALVAVKTVALALALNYGVHIGSGMAYAKLCMPESVWDLARSVVTTASPACSFLVSTMQVTQMNYATLMSSTLLGIATGALTPA